MLRMKSPLGATVNPNALANAGEGAMKGPIKLPFPPSKIMTSPKASLVPLVV